MANNTTKLQNYIHVLISQLNVFMKTNAHVWVHLARQRKNDWSLIPVAS